MKINRRKIMKGASGVGLVNSVPLASALENPNYLSNTQVDFNLEDVWPILVDMAREEIGGMISFSSDVGTQSTYRQRQNYDEALGSHTSSTPGLPIDLCADIPRTRQLCVKDPLNWVDRAMGRSPESCNTTVRMVRFGFNAADFQWDGGIFWGGSWDPKTSIRCWLGIDEYGCLWAGTEPGGSMNSSPDGPIDASWAFSVCGGPICPDEVISPAALTAELAAESAFHLAKGFLEDAINWWDNLTVWEKAIFIAIVAFSIVGLVVVAYVGIPTITVALGVGATLAGASTVG